MNYEKHIFYYWGKWNEPIRNSAHTTKILEIGPQKHVF